ncbi:hypothetical protein BD324DRAFT_636922 [Kockovaella imperatae]|uniref:PX domain-containing protein n=1 Tax=Kockovaella imperatae TaxID=4999 RepID=A0A1Y1U836_9TREE|nr:hypothetical protein BD324DRAFT_636922 [Kockovaella imperatae]ORX34172.1 hypothetical protein BD324DRAFT_636922 [Kockovaella imperatae]
MPEPSTSEVQPKLSLLTRVSRSPSLSSLTSEESFNPHANPVDPEFERKTAATKPALGVRELIHMARTEKEKSSRSNRSVIPPESPLAFSPPVEIRLFGGDNLADDLQAGGGRAQHHGGEVPDGEYEHRSLAQIVALPLPLTETVRDSRNAPFAREVEIKGWKVVGGKTWTGAARVGAYVVYEIEIIFRTGGSTTILRRYTDFVNLRAALDVRFPGFREAIPVLPGKAHMAKFSAKFLADRQSRLGLFLRAVMLHPVMGRGGPNSVVGAWVTDDT